MPWNIEYINLDKWDELISSLSIEEIYNLRDNDIKNAVLDRLKVIDGMDLPRVASK